jgi:hypothetical protein
MKTKSTSIRIKQTDKDWLLARATRNHRKMPEELSAIRDLMTILERASGPMDVLPHPADCEPVPVTYRQTRSE